MEWLTARIFLRSSTLKWFNSLGTLSVNLILRVIDAIKPIHKSGEKLDSSNYQVSRNQCHPKDFYCHHQGHVDC